MEIPLINGLHEVHIVDPEGKKHVLKNCFANDGCSVEKLGDTISSEEGIGNSQETITERINSNIKLVLRHGSTENKKLQGWFDGQKDGLLCKSIKLLEAPKGKAPTTIHETIGDEGEDLVFIKKPPERTFIGATAKDRTWEILAKKLSWPAA